MLGADVGRSIGRSVVQESSFDLSTNGKLLSHDLRRSGSVEFYGNLTGTFEGNYSRGEHDSPFSPLLIDSV